MKKFVLQSVITIALSSLIAWLLGATVYIGIGAFVFFVALGVFYSRHGLFDNDESAPGSIWILMTLGYAFIVAAFWSVLVLAWSWHGPMTRAIARSRGDDDDEPESGEAPNA